MIIPSITPLPPSPQRTDPSTFAARADASLTAQETVFTPELNAFASAVNVTQAEMTALSTNATNQALSATLSATAAAASALAAGATIWVSGTTYAIGNARYSPINGQVYRRLTAGAGTTDPSLDSTNWIVVNGLTSEAIVLPVNNLPLIRPSLLLDFANSQAVDPRITFTRASTATRTNSKGLIELVPSGVPRIDFDPITGACKGLLIEEQRTNLLTYSEQFDNAAWVKVNIAVTPGAMVAPDGSRTAHLVTAVATATAACQRAASITINTVYTASVFFKAGTAGFLNLSFSDNVDSGCNGWVNVSTLATTTAPFGGWTFQSMTVTPLADGWYRASLTCLSNSSDTTINVYASQCNANNTGIATAGQTIFLWGAQLEAGAFPTTYRPSTETFTGRASTATFFGSNGLIQTASSGAARLNYNPMNLTVAPKLLLEAAGTNLIWPSVPDATWYSGAGVALTYNDSVSPDGTVTATKVSSLADLGTYKTVTISSGVIHCHSFYLKNSTAVRLVARDDTGSGRHILIDPVAGVITGTSGAILGYGSVPCGNGYTRYWFSFMSDSTNARCTVRNDVSATTVLFWIWGAQLEANAFPTSYIPTVGSQVTRAADTSTSAQTTRADDVASMTGANFNSWYRQDEGSLLANFSTQQDYATGFNAVFAISDGTSSNRIAAVCNSSGNVINIETNAGGVVSSSYYPAYVSGASSVALAIKSNDANYAKDGVAGTADTSVVVPVVSQMNIGTINGGGSQLNGHLRAISFYPKRLTNAELVAISTQ